LIRLHDGVLARVFALQTVLQDLGVLSPRQVQRRTDELREQFAADLEARLAQKKTDLTPQPRMSGRSSFSMDAQTAAILAEPNQTHIVYPYTDERYLVDAIGFYTKSGLARDAAVILIVTEAHREAIRRYLEADFNVHTLEVSGQLSFLDAAELLSFFMVDGKPDPKLFKDGIRTLIERAQRDERMGRNREVRLFGEMVSLLWPANSTAAERLEELGNEVTEEYSISILCAYSMSGPGRGQLPESLIKAHSHSISW
jgi:MEDS: MEthanogen/methylotroph, DcmR Sensory domain